MRLCVRQHPSARGPDWNNHCTARHNHTVMREQAITTGSKRCKLPLSHSGSTRKQSGSDAATLTLRIDSKTVRQRCSDSQPASIQSQVQSIRDQPWYDCVRQHQSAHGSDWNNHCTARPNHCMTLEQAITTGSHEASCHSHTQNRLENSPAVMQRLAASLHSVAGPKHP